MLKKSLKKLKKLEEKVFSRGHKSLRDHWRMVRYFPEFARHVISALEAISKEKKASAPALQPAQVASSPTNVLPLTPSLPKLGLGDIRDQVRSGRVLVMIPEGRAHQFIVDSSQSQGMSITLGSSETVITAGQNYDAVVFLETLDPAFCETNRYFLNSGRILLYRWDGKSMNFVHPESRT